MLLSIKFGDALLAAVMIAVSGTAALSFLIRENAFSAASVSKTMMTAEGRSLRVSTNSKSASWHSANTRARDVPLKASRTSFEASGLWLNVINESDCMFYLYLLLETRNLVLFPKCRAV